MKIEEWRVEGCAAALRLKAMAKTPGVLTGDPGEGYDVRQGIRPVRLSSETPGVFFEGCAAALR